MYTHPSLILQSGLTPGMQRGPCLTRIHTWDLVYTYLQLRGIMAVYVPTGDMLGSLVAKNCWAHVRLGGGAHFATR